MCFLYHLTCIIASNYLIWLDVSEEFFVRPTLWITVRFTQKHAPLVSRFFSVQERGPKSHDRKEKKIRYRPIAKECRQERSDSLVRFDETQPKKQAQLWLLLVLVHYHWRRQLPIIIIITIIMVTKSKFFPDFKETLPMVRARCDEEWRRKTFLHLLLDTLTRVHGRKKCTKRIP